MPAPLGVDGGQRKQPRQWTKLIVSQRPQPGPARLVKQIVLHPGSRKGLYASSNETVQNFTC